MADSGRTWDLLALGVPYLNNRHSSLSTIQKSIDNKSIGSSKQQYNPITYRIKNEQGWVRIHPVHHLNISHFLKPLQLSRTLFCRNKISKMKDIELWMVIWSIEVFIYIYPAFRWADRKWIMTLNAVDACSYRQERTMTRSSTSYFIFFFLSSEKSLPLP